MNCENLAMFHAEKGKEFDAMFSVLIGRTVKSEGKRLRLARFNSAGVPYFHSVDDQNRRTNDKEYTVDGCDYRWAKWAVEIVGG